MRLKAAPFPAAVLAAAIFAAADCRSGAMPSPGETNLAGVVTFARDDLPFCFMRDSGGVSWRVSRPPSSPPLRPGDTIAASGRREPSVKHRLQSSRVVATGREPGGPPPPRHVSIKELFANIMPFGDTLWYGGVFTVEGTLRDINRRQSVTQILVGEGDCNIFVELPVAIEDALPAFLTPGAIVEATGALAWTSIENLEEGSFGRIENVELLPESVDAVKIVRRAPAPPFWTVERLWSAFAAVAAAMVLLFAWILTLRRMVRRKTRELEESVRQRATARIEADASRRERLRLAADLHDGFQQYLAGAMFRLKAALNYLPGGESKCREQLEKARDALQHTQNGLRQTIWAMNEESEGPESLPALFRFAARRMAHWDGVVSIESEGEERPVARTFCGSLLLVVQEAVGNAIRHGAARHVAVRVSYRDREIVLTVEDDGGGFDVSGVSSSGGHYGLSTMERRVGSLGGSMEIKSAPGKGTLVRFVVPA